MWSIQNILLLAAGIINLAMSIFIISRGVRNKNNLYFSFLTFFNFTWAVGLFLSRFVDDIALAELFYRSAFISAISIAIALFYFTHNYHYKIKIFNHFHTILIWLPGILLSFFAYSKYHIINFERVGATYRLYVQYGKWFYIFFSIYFITMILFSIYFLYLKHKNTEGVIRERLGLLMYAIIAGLFFGSYFDLFISYFGNVEYIWLGPIFTLFMNGVVFYLIKSPRKA